ncbi:SusC/RagA family TonB-linked outer membrane protein [Fodinibius salsisoli]|uniref:TonB-dependent receptor n=1 Tax=Fodinibius salsisoli TaxID=2820877 RepID=A0ABT3PQ53_9BACT|nr:TonB-dependent receptor [Fodinibius salsisoli]MCW9707993.1 TonB-dependent receptor [Fodinibius salsisoli]
MTITGKVINTTNQQPLPGVNITVKGTSSGTTTNTNGAFEITAPDDATLVFSFIGFETKEVPVNGQSSLSVSLTESTEALEEVLVLGYTTQSKEESTSSVVQVSGEDLNDVTTSSATEALQGKAAGVFVTSASGQPGPESDTKVRIRGTGSISAGAEPLYVVDGVIGGTFDPNDVASINVLKDASATSLYGSRAANGVVVVQTKSGSAGETQLNVSSTVGWNQRSNGNFEVMNGQQLYSYHERFESPILESDYQNRNTNWQDLAFRTGLTNKYEASASGGDEQTTFYISGNYYDEEGTLVSTGYERFGGRVNVDHQFTDNFNVSAKIAGRYANEVNNPAGALYQSYINMPWDRPFGENGEIRTGKESNWIGRDQSNFLYPMQYNFNKKNSKRLTANVRGEYDFADWLYFTSTNRITYSNSRNESFSDSRTAAGSTNNGELYNYYAQSSSFLSSNLLNFEHNFGPHTVSGVLGFEYETNYADGTGGTGTGIFSGLEILDVTAEAFSLGGYKSESKFISGLSQVSYDYENTYFAKLSFRRDGSSRFGRNNRYGNFYSVGGSWIISNEEFLESASQVTNLKLRASYGTTGNADISNYLASGLYAYSVQYAGEAASQPERIENPDLTWEVAEMANIGVDFGLFDRVDLSVDLYQKTNDDLLQNVILPGTSGFDNITRNIGSVRNRGVELGISSTNIQGALNWTTNFNIAFNNNEVLSLNNGEDIPNGNQRIMEGKDLRTWYMRKWAGVDPENGNPLWVKQEKDENGNVVSETTTSNYSEASLMSVGSASPDFSGGFGNTLEYKGWKLNAFFNFVYGNKIYHSARELFDSDGAYATYNAMVLMDDWNRWQESGDQATHPKPVYGGNNNSNKPSSRYLEDGSYIRLQNISLSYNLPGSWISELGIRSARIFASGDNLLTITSFSGMDPEVDLDGIAGTKYPISKKYLLGIELGF